MRFGGVYFPAISTKTEYEDKKILQIGEFAGFFVFN